MKKLVIVLSVAVMAIGCLCGCNTTGDEMTTEVTESVWE